MRETRDCVDCRYEGTWSYSIPCDTCSFVEGKPNFKPKPKPKQEKTMKSVEDEARELLTKLEITDADMFTSGELVDLAELIADSRELKRLKAAEAVPWVGVDPAAPEGDRTVVSATDAVAKIMGYSHPLYEAFDDAVKQATKGKGVRHGGDATPFLEQPIMQISKHTGVGGLIFQMVKKAQEACGKDDQEAFERELLGALVYGGAAYLYVKQHGFKK